MLCNKSNNLFSSNKNTRQLPMSLPLLSLFPSTNDVAFNHLLHFLPEKDTMEPIPFYTLGKRFVPLCKQCIGFWLCQQWDVRMVCLIYVHFADFC